MKPRIRRDPRTGMYICVGFGCIGFSRHSIQHAYETWEANVRAPRSIGSDENGPMEPLSGIDWAWVTSAGVLGVAVWGVAIFAWCRFSG